MTPPVADDIFSAQYFLSSIVYVNGVNLDETAANRERTIDHLEHAKQRIDRAIGRLVDHEDS